ncbi:MAG: phage holin family protein [Actinomycetes bacterium]
MPTGAHRPGRRSGPAEQAYELKDLVVDYAKQETVQPLRNLGRYFGYGLAGAAALGTGVVFLLLALLRGLQRLQFLNNVREPDGGTFAWAPYLIVMVVGIGVAYAFLRTLINLSKKGQR